MKGDWLIILLLLSSYFGVCLAVPHYVINLESRPDRWEQFTSQNKNNLPLEITRIQASNAEDAQAALDEGTIRLNATFRDPKWLRPMKLGEVACSMSHIQAWKKIAAQQSSEYGVVLEDDAHLLDAYDKYLDKVVEKAAAQNQTIDFVYLTYRDSTGRKQVDEVFSSCVFTYWTLGYMMSRQAARKLLNDLESYRMNLIPIDEYYPIVLGTLDGDENNKDPRYPDTRLSCLSVTEPMAKPFDGSTSDTEKSSVVLVEANGDIVSSTTDEESLLVLTVATDENHFGYQNLLYSANFFAYQLVPLGLGQRWTGGDDLSASTGGGMKLILVRDYLNTIDPEQLVVFTDGYDTLFQLDSAALFKRYHEMDTDVVFAAEVSCWPSRLLCDQYINVAGRGAQTTDFQYLNSGNYMGKAKHLLTLLQNFNASDPTFDDQLYMSEQYLASLRGEIPVKVTIDAYCQLFFPLNHVPRENWEMNHNFLHNKATNTVPVIVHGNGPSSRTLVGVSNYLAGAYCRFYKTIKYVQVPDISPYSLALGLFLQGTAFETDFVESIESLGMDRSQTFLFVNYAPTSKLQLPQHFIDSFQGFDSTNHSDECHARARFLRRAMSFRADYAIMIDSDIIVEMTDVVEQLVSWNRTVVVGHARRENALWSNYWTDMSDSGWYQRGFDTIDLYDHKKPGLFQVPYGRGLVLLRSDMHSRMNSLYTSNIGSNDDCPRRVSLDMMNEGIPMYADNRHHYATMLGSETRSQPDAPFPDLYEAQFSPSLWAKHYLVANYSSVAFDEPCQDVYGAKIFTKKFCDEMVATAEHYGDWSSGEHQDSRLTGGYENFPTQDIHFNQLKWEESWLHILQTVVRPMVLSRYEGLTFKGNINIAFVIRYSMGGQRDLDAHNDASLVTTTVSLTNTHTGGGVCFTRYNCTVHQPEPGYLLMHPGRVTHNHKALPITSGSRYVLVSFNES